MSPKVLHLWDSIMSRNIVGRLLQSKGYEVTTVATLEEALAWVAENQPDLIIVDLDSPLMSGYEIGSALRNNKKTAQTPMMCLPDLHIDNEETLRQAGYDSCLSKPIEISEFIAHVNKLVKRQK